MCPSFREHRVRLCWMHTLHHTSVRFGHGGQSERHSKVLKGPERVPLDFVAPLILVDTKYCVSGVWHGAETCVHLTSGRPSKSSRPLAASVVITALWAVLPALHLASPDGAAAGTWSSLSSPTRHPGTTVCSLYVCFCLVCLFCFSHSTYKCRYVGFVSPCVTYLAEHSSL